jgi:outer membrane protein assembly factor BamB
MKKTKLMGIALSVLLVSLVFSGILSEMVKGMNRGVGFHSPDKCAFSGIGVNLNSQLTTPRIGLPGSVTSRLVFQTKFEIKSNSTDFGHVKISADGGSTWDTLHSFQGSQLDWIYKEIDLSSYAGETVEILFEYTTGPDLWHSFNEGWYIDRIIVEKDGMIPYSEYFEQYYLGTEIGGWSVVEKPAAIDIEYITLGSGNTLCHSFAIFADPQVGVGGGDISRLQAAVDEIIEINNDLDPNNDIEFVIVLGDLIQGERIPGTFPIEWKGEGADDDFESYRGEYFAVQQELERLETEADTLYVPAIGNHDVWCKFSDYVHDNNPPDYPEELFAEYFDAQYDELSLELDGWTDQRSLMPIANPYQGLHPPNIYFQNFAFDYGPYHFIFLDFCAREDSDPFQGLLVKKLWGYADLHDADEGGDPITHGTWEWLEGHLEECESEGIRDVIILTHHPPVYELDTTVDAEIKESILFADSTGIKGEMHIVLDPLGTLTDKTLSNRTQIGLEVWDSKIIPNGTTVDRIEGDAVFGFNKINYDEKDEYDNLTNLFSSYNINIVHWFSAHYHLKGFNWFDSNIGAAISIVPSIMKAEDIYGIDFTGQVEINELQDAVITPIENPNGCFTIVHVMCPEWSDWPTFHHDRQRTGVASGNGIITDTTTFRWAYPPLVDQPIGAVCGSPVVGPDGTIYFGATDGYLYALNPDGTLKWKSNLDGEIASSPVLLPSTSISPYRGRVYVGTDGDPNFFAIDTATGEKIWELQVPTGNPFAIKAGSSPLLVVDPAGGEPVLYVGAANGYLYCIRDHGGAGEVIWGRQLQPADLVNGFYSSPVESPVGLMGRLSTIYCGGQETRIGPNRGKAKLFALDPYSGNDVCNPLIFTSQGYVSSPAVGLLEGVETIFAGTSDGRMRAVVIQGGTLVEKTNYLADASIATCPAIYDLNGDNYVEIIFGTDGGVIYALTYTHDSAPPSFSESWTSSIGGTIRSSASVALTGLPTVFVGGCSSSGNIYSITWDGTFLHSYETLNSEPCITSSPAIAQRSTDLLGAPGWIFIGSSDSLSSPSEGRLYAFGPPGRSFKVEEPPRVEKDSDSDGVPDDEDQCYNPDCTLVDETGCPIDSDGDTIPDCEDECPEEAGIEEKRGCPEAGTNGLILVVLGIIVAWKLTKFTE